MQAQKEGWISTNTADHNDQDSQKSSVFALLTKLKAPVFLYDTFYNTKTIFGLKPSCVQANRVKIMKPTIVPPTKKVMLMCLGILLTAAMYPHGSCENKTNSNGGEKLKAYARANDLAFVNANWVSANYATADITASASKACAWQKSRNNAGAHSFQGEVKKNRCGRGYSKSYLASQLLDMFSGDPGDDDADVVLERCDLGMSGQTINGNVVTILGVYGYMEAAQSMISSYSIKIWLP